jgi:hypothetical protein
MTEVKVRLTAGAALEFSEVLADALDHIDIEKMMRARNANDENAVGELGGDIIKSALKYSRHSAFKFLASTAGMTVDELKDQPLSTVTAIITQIKQDPELKDFLAQARGMLS